MNTRYRSVPAISFIVFCLTVCAPVSFAQENSHIQDENVRGVVSAVNEAVLTTDLRAQVIALPLRTGGTFNKGDVLVKFDCEVQRADTDAVQAAYEGARARFNNQREMQALDAAGEFDVTLAKAEMNEAHARFRAMNARNKKCQIIAPYDGKISQMNINIHEVPEPNQPLMKIVGYSQLELRLIVPAKWLTWLNAEEGFSFVIDETGHTHRAKVARLGAEIDAVSRTVSIIGVFAEEATQIIPGMSGTARFSVPGE